ncbi:endothelin-converting enzyme 1-like [Ornithodoros turicata]
MDKENARTVASSIDVEVFYPVWMSNTSYREAYDAIFPEITRGNVMRTYRDFVQRITETRLALVRKRDDPTFKLTYWKPSVFNVQPSFDYETMTIYIPPVIFNTTYARGDVSVAAQIPFIGPRLIFAYLEGIHEKSYPSFRYHWSLNSTVRAIELELCLSRQYANWTDGHETNTTPRRPLTMQYDFLDNLAIEGALQLYLKYISVVKSQNLQDSAFLTPGNLTSIKLFYVLYAEGFCENAESERLRGELQDDPISSPRTRVNVPLRNYPDFAADWDCRPRAPMSPKKRCSMWLP